MVFVCNSEKRVEFDGSGSIKSINLEYLVLRGLAVLRAHLSISAAACASSIDTVSPFFKVDARASALLLNPFTPS